MGNTLVGPGVLRDTLQYPPTTEGSIMVGRNNSNSNGSHYYQQHSTSTPSVPLGGLGGLLATPPSTMGTRFRRSYFGQFVFLIGLLSLIIFLQDSMLSSSSSVKDPVFVVGNPEDVRNERKGGLGGLSGGYSRVQTVTTSITQDPLLGQQQKQQRQQSTPLPQPLQPQQEQPQDEKEEWLMEAERLLKADEAGEEKMTETVAAVMKTTAMIEPAAFTPSGINNDNNHSNSDDRIGGMKEKTMQWMKTFANLLLGHGPLDLDEVVVVEQENKVRHGMVDDEGLAVFIPETKQQGQEAEIVSLPAVAVMDLPGQESIPEYQILSNPATVNLTPPPPLQAPPLAEPIHAKHHWTPSRIQKALDPTLEALTLLPPPRPQDKGDKLSRLEIVTWQQDQDLTECRGQKDNYEHDIENLRHVIEEQDSDLRDLRGQIEALKAQAAAFEVELK
ncbi:hypothetical protein BG015_011944 [Linnemannia schmuckeri]|uniref:Transmembrane protein n=1 Tax=Linnemannia schmuckeri TaxID=64567 RepID=A0A9P5RUM8_9FUNG|nr:hypothetical protein BG015_011944 [Linnemannia schmuckeri]